MKFSDYLKQYSKLRMLLIGRSGVGKTRLAALATRFGKTFLMVTEDSGLISAKKVINEKNAEIEVANNLEDVQRIFDMISARQNEFEFIVIDGLSAVNSMLVNEYSQIEGIPTIKDWQIIIARLQRLVHALKSLNIHLICTALEDSKESATTRVVEPNFAGKNGIEIPAQFDTVLRMGISKTDGKKKGGDNGQLVYEISASGDHITCKDRLCLSGTYDVTDLGGVKIFQTLLDALKTK